MNNVNVLKYPGRYGSSNADCVHLHGVRGHVQIQNSFFEGAGDDGMAITNQVTLVIAVTTTTITLNSDTSSLPNSAHSPLEASLTDHSSLAALFMVGDTIAISHIETPFVNFATAIIETTSPATNGTVLTIQGGVPPGVVVGDVVTDLSVASSTFYNVTVRNSRARAALIRTIMP